MAPVLALVLLLGADPAPPTSSPPVPAAASAPSPHRTVGLSLLAGGAALGTGTAAAATLIEALTTPDDGRVAAKNTELTQVSGFVTVSLASLSFGMMLLGGALLLEDEGAGAAPPATPSGS